MKEGMLNDIHTQDKLGETEEEIEERIENDVWPKIDSLMQELGFKSVDVDLVADLDYETPTEGGSASSRPFRDRDKQKIKIGELEASVEPVIAHERTHVEQNSYFFDLVDYLESFAVAEDTIVPKIHMADAEDFRFSALWHRDEETFKDLVQSAQKYEDDLADDMDLEKRSEYPAHSVTTDEIEYWELSDEDMPEEIEKLAKNRKGLMMALEREIDRRDIREPFESSKYGEGFCDGLMMSLVIGEDEEIWQQYWEGGDGYNRHEDVVKISKHLYEIYNSCDSGKRECMKRVFDCMEEFYTEGRLE